MMVNKAPCAKDINVLGRQEGGRPMITIFAIANTENKNYEYLCDLKGRVKQTLPVGSNVKIYLPCAVHSSYYLLKDMKRIHEVDKVIILDDGHTDLYTDILIYHYDKLTEIQQATYEDM